ncbi:endonuclease/exonuclease/phosphatase family protein [Umboniibacter marinipuniceus]|uniref:Endonuclease/exonuclease/phosphatase (EEP) superfamily protein YafD n=1 Tax=Umboniibacter marinipuniceus TaxID=569599 RepID=A0A3M0A8W6_9GAMM|nr:endonuclease/exonuclease/phosphatase family protein [Umboniibacter marinipuniceus]RMA78855.1 endonuclease/exonuclease/phosphatase (EEP) superfamily protein YafD [Umboniibacter marinipuniceus]
MNRLHVSDRFRLIDLALLLFISFALTMTLSMIDPDLPSNQPTSPVSCEFFNTSGQLPQELQVVNWNIAKEPLAKVREALHNTSVNLLVLQESAVDEGFLFSPGHRALETTGVALESRVSPSKVCHWQSFEPIMLTPKAAIAASFPIAGSEDELLVINLHGVNFSWLLGTWKRQIRTAALLAKSHKGPIILAGDLNTWRYERSRFIKQVAEELGLAQPAYVEDNRTAPFGYPLDWILSRGINWTEVSAPNAELSDHNPILATGIIVTTAAED